MQPWTAGWGTLDFGSCSSGNRCHSHVPPASLPQPLPPPPLLPLPSLRPALSPTLTSLLPPCPPARRLQQAFSEVKAEVRELLARQYGVTQMTMKPVLRQYAFEDPAIPHGKQWVLKVRWCGGGGAAVGPWVGGWGGQRASDPGCIGGPVTSPAAPMPEPECAKHSYMSAMFASPHHTTPNAFLPPLAPRPPAPAAQVKYAASQAQALPVGLSGATFAALLGGNQSMLEALTLKRRVMGPSWLSIKHPRRVPPEAQVSWCKLEVEVDSHKSVTANPTDNK